MNMVLLMQSQINHLFGELYTHWGKETDEDIRERKQNWKHGFFWDLYYTLHSCPFFQECFLEKRGG